ncbi:MAG: PKD domain-containing protein [Cyclobacteriaceae bacterium]
MIFAFVYVNGQSPIADFAVSSAPCLQQDIDVVNNSIGADRFEWDFCLDDFKTLNSNTNVAPIVGLNGGFGYKIVEDNGLWYGFAVSQSTHSIIRLDFGDAPTNAPTVVNLGNPGNSLLFPQGIDLYKNNGAWFAFVGFNDNNYGLVRLDFGSDLTSAPTSVNIGNFGVTGRFWDLRIIKQSTDLILVIIERNTGSIVRVNYRDSFLNAISIPTHVFNTGPISGAALTPGIDVVKKGGDWFAFLTSSSNKIFQVSFGNNILGSATVDASYTFTGVTNPFRVKMTQEGSNYFAVVTNQSALIDVIDMKDLNIANPPSEISFGGLPQLLAIDVIRYRGKSIVQGIGNANNQLRQMIFEASCGASVNFSEEINPKSINYASSGLKTIELKAFNSSSGQYSVDANQLVVSSSTAPDISFTSQNICANHDINFSSESVSGGITDYNWDFGDTNTSMLENPTHQYASAGDYEVSLTVTASNGCNNLARENITIYNEPVPDFDLPTIAPICTNQGYIFTNNSTFDLDSNPTWQWEVNGNPVSIDQDLNYSITSATQQDVKLIASIPGCSNEIIKSILTVEEGPLAGFTFSNDCVETSIEFTNTTAGPVTGYSWDFGDTNMSSQTNGQNTYTGFGVYDVTLTASNAAGCNNSITKPITIYSKPQPDFSLDLPPFSCSGSPSQFNDLTPNPTDSNLAGWTWSFGDPASGSSTERNPQYIFSDAGNYDVQLDVITNFGCSNSVQKTINIAQSPPSGFSFNPACVNQGTVFTPNAINGINSWQWTIGAATYSSQSPTHIFSFPSTYNAQLTVTGSNGCVATSSQPITVPTVPSLDFSASNLCEDQPVEFMDVTSIGLDVPTAWTWEFGTAGTAAGESPSFTFDSPGSYPTKMTVTNQSGCRYSISKNISVVTSPTATFTATPQIGTAPLVVQLTNTTNNSNSQLWTINGTGETSTDDSPAFTFDELGDYVIDLTVTNEQGCESTTSKTVSVVVPTLDLELTSLTVVPAVTGEQRLLVSIKNNSNSTIAGPKLAVDIAGQAVINELLNVTLLPGATHTQMLATQVVGARGDLDYICVEIVLDGDFNKSNNKKCVGTNSISVLDPYPNPSTETINLEWISEESGNAEVYIFNSVGNKVFENAFANFQPGLNRVAVDVDNLNPGIYYLLFVTGDNRRSFPVIIRR